MPTIWLFAIVLVTGLAGFALARGRAVASAGGDTRVMHSRPLYHGLNGLLTAMLPALGLLVAWLILQPVLLDRAVVGAIPPEVLEDGAARSLVMADVRRVADGLDAAIAAGVATPEGLAALTAEDDVRGLLGQAGVALGSDVSPYVLEAARDMRATAATLRVVMWVAVLAVLAIGLGVALKRSHADYRARNFVERGVLVLLVAAASIAVLTTVGIVASMLFETVNFFSQYPASSFFFSTNWDPSFSGRGGGSELGIVPLLWGTLYISFIALLVAVPVGLLAAIYLSEFASKRMRSVAKPVIEVLAGIPTIVYGLFALITVGPLLRDAIASPLGLGNSASSVMTAGLVMGIMLIPFVSSLSDDIINAVPQAMRDGSFGLGATHAETIRQVILPAALPGIVGAVLLAASRAIGETMIVVLGAGAAAKLSLNPFEAMTTVTVKIVSQLTGDTDFASPETLVAFALGLTLFVITLGLNVLALYIVRTYREQYE
ncbi:phosphate ABC transporter permease subunit PstC [Jannaschia sp. Os4]|uniref:phosphate ABC transporter permease subunit PstC n=1 Tax=Jannaschia sp. Os4 TaxID=2807617 RepID=UPI001939CA65|nr:phosphate ABC transporter permease subunit PstC [Jannaschia sp. Os4]MBM2576523.1 phosphate ABC transporter permease subunit PstC [Jannaschia sp. Os4]